MATVTATALIGRHVKVHYQPVQPRSGGEAVAPSPLTGIVSALHSAALILRPDPKFVHDHGYERVVWRRIRKIDLA